MKNSAFVDVDEALRRASTMVVTKGHIPVGQWKEFNGLYRLTLRGVPCNLYVHKDGKEWLAILAAPVGPWGFLPLETRNIQRYPKSKSFPRPDDIRDTYEELARDVRNWQFEPFLWQGLKAILLFEEWLESKDKKGKLKKLRKLALDGSMSQLHRDLALSLVQSEVCTTLTEKAEAAMAWQKCFC